MAQLHKVETIWENITEDTQEEVKAQLYIPGRFDIPYLKNEQRENSFGLSCELTIVGRPCILRKHESHLEIIADLTGATNPEDRLDLILQGLSIAIGCQLRPRLKKVSRLGQQVHVIYSHYKDDRHLKLPCPIPTSPSDNAANLQVFLDKFIEAIGDPHSPLFGYWFRVLQAFSSDVENRALVLTTAIEGLLKSYYSDIGAPDTEFLNQLSDAKAQIKSLPIAERVRNKLISTLGNAKATSPRNSLFALVETKFISEDLVTLWTKLRNKSAHADEKKFEPHELQAFINELHGCLELFYLLVLGKIGYSGEIVQYSVTGWPKRNLGLSLHSNVERPSAGNSIV